MRNVTTIVDAGCADGQSGVPRPTAPGKHLQASDHAPSKRRGGGVGRVSSQLHNLSSAKRMRRRPAHTASQDSSI